MYTSATDDKQKAHFSKCFNTIFCPIFKDLMNNKNDFYNYKHNASDHEYAYMLLSSKISFTFKVYSSQYAAYIFKAITAKLDQNKPKGRTTSDFEQLNRNETLDIRRMIQ